MGKILKGRSDLLHFVMQAASGKNAENAEMRKMRTIHTKNTGVSGNSAARKRESAEHTAKLGIIERGGTASLRSRTCVKRKVVFRVRFKGFFFSVFSLLKGESDTYQNGLGYTSDTYPNPYPPVTVPPL